MPAAPSGVFDPNSTPVVVKQVVGPGYGAAVTGQGRLSARSRLLEEGPGLV
jgi:hypothetical protein